MDRLFRVGHRRKKFFFIFFFELGYVRSLGTDILYGSLCI